MHDVNLETKIIRSGEPPKVKNVAKEKKRLTVVAEAAGLRSHYDYLRLTQYLEENGGYQIMNVSFGRYQPKTGRYVGRYRLLVDSVQLYFASSS